MFGAHVEGLHENLAGFALLIHFPFAARGSTVSGRQRWRVTVVSNCFSGPSNVPYNFIVTVLPSTSTVVLVLPCAPARPMSLLSCLPSWASQALEVGNAPTIFHPTTLLSSNHS